MKRTILLAAATLALALIISTTAAALAGPFMGGKGGHGVGGPGIGGMRALMQLDLSQDQKQSIYDILQKYQDKQQAVRISIREHKKEFFDLTSDGNFNEEEVRQAFQESVPALEEAFILRAKIKSEIYAVLTSAQLEELQQIRTEHAGRRHGGKNNGFRRAMLETWLLMDNE